MAKCKTAPGKKNKKKKILFAAFSLIFTTSSCGLVSPPWVPRGNQGCASAGGFWSCCWRPPRAKLSSATPLSTDNSGSNPWFWSSQAEPNPVTPELSSVAADSSHGLTDPGSSHFSHYKGGSALPVPPPGDSLMAPQWHFPQSCNALRVTWI